MKDFSGRLAVVTGGGSGMGHELAVQLASEGCHVAMCDVSAENMAETRARCEAAAPAATRITTHACDVSDEAAVFAFRDAVLAAHGSEHVNLLFSNAGIGGGGSFVADGREDWERTFNVCWYGVYHCARAFMPALVASDAGYLVNTASVNGFWASLGPHTPHSAYSAAKFAVKGFSEALITDLRLNAPHVKVAVVMPGHIGTSIVANSAKVLGRHAPEELTAQEVAEVRERLASSGMPVGNEPDEHIRAMLQQRAVEFRDNAPTTASQAAGIILDGVRAERWRILVGDDAQRIDELVRALPEEAYEPGFTQRIVEGGDLQGLIRANAESAGQAD